MRRNFNLRNLLYLSVVLVLTLLLCGYLYRTSFPENVSYDTKQGAGGEVGKLLGTSTPSKVTDGEWVEKHIPLSAMTKHVYMSPDSNYMFTVYWIEQDDRCLFTLSDRSGKQYDLSSLLDFDKIYCSFASGTNSSFNGWLDNDSFLLSENYRNPRVVHLSNHTVQEFAPQGESLIFRVVDSKLEYWVFQDGPEGIYKVFNSSMTLLKEVENRSYESEPIFDPIHNGFLFYGRTYTKEGLIGVQFDFFYLSSLTLKTVLVTPPIRVPGMGCNGPSEYVLSTPHSLVITPGCLKVDSAYMRDGNIVIPLP